MKIFRRFLVAIVLIIIVAMLVFNIYSNQMVKQAKETNIESVSFADLTDGTYQGSSQIGPVKVVVEAEIADGNLQSLNLIEHLNGFGRRAEAILPAMIEGETLDVDIISGATVSSITIKKAVEEAVKQSTQ